jgi:nitric oxide reductase NorD protein
MRGDDLDVAAYVSSVSDRRAGHAPDDRLYIDVRPARRALAIAILADTSGSTDMFVTDTKQIIDVEKEALLLASEALDALGDPYALLTFSSRGSQRVRVATIKGFNERNGDAVRGRIGSITPGSNTRLGAAVRHVAALLAAQPAAHRLLLILSDGKPNDSDRYQGPYAVEDARRALLEARAIGVHPFCLTVDVEEPAYLAHLFGASGYTILRKAEQLPMALVSLVRQLLIQR